MRFPKSLAVFSLLLLLLGLSFAEGVRVRYGVHPDFVRVVLDLPKEVPYRVFTLKNPYRVVIDLKDPKTRLTRVKLPFKWRKGRHPWGVRLVIETGRPYEPKVFLLKRGPRLVVDLYRSKAAAKRSKGKKPLVAFEPVVVVIDPGHGGTDPGAIGHRGLQEKWVNLQIARRLARYFKKDPLFKVYLTRSGDRTLKLRQRVVIARRYKPDIFISIHADAAPRKNPRVRGTTIYALDWRAARRVEKALKNDPALARKLIGKQATSNRLVHALLSDMAFDDTALKASEKLGRYIARELKRRLKRKVKFKGIKRANFAVLKVPGTLAVLVEVGYITNPVEERRLRDPRFQEQVARAIYEAVRKFVRDYMKVKETRLLVER
ncbi:MAG: N-acetylmuramoyl-L-alanine amidase [Aquificae bacterium]|nr:N-acetylmuramoyl-L-alanine amidase [Aquificota bacterium]